VYIYIALYQKISNGVLLGFVIITNFYVVVCYSDSKIYSVCYRAMHFSAKRGIAIVYCLSVRP